MPENSVRRCCNWVSTSGKEETEFRLTGCLMARFWIPCNSILVPEIEKAIRSQYHINTA
ncbi:hypothetical protein MANES_11G105451v8 [Manihot esculenta]|uniref:Uncharacterized protein n=1 Tax=Manihot esculenta TaxID=3983 RepID=A0ACB7GXE0_MANES|nr:hypothetical protein MANES_11G105451v8 [Manihot esculenta]